MAEDENGHYDCIKILDSLFRRAKEQDEFEYICALSGLDTLVHPVNLLAETWALLRDLVGLPRAPLRTETRLRLGLLLYCHLLEAKPIYAMLDNMLSAAEGNRCSMDPFFNLSRPKSKDRFPPERIPPSTKKVFETVTAHARKVGFGDVADMLDAVFDAGLRNAFFHSDYCIVDDLIQSRYSWFQDGNVRSQSIRVDRAFEKVQNALALYGAFESLYVQHRLSYQEPKRIRGRFGPNDNWVDIYVHVDPNRGGLVGFRSTPGPPSQPSERAER